LDRRTFLNEGALCATALGSAAAEARRFALENKFLAWQVETSSAGIRSTAFHNKLSGRRVELGASTELALVFSASRQRLEIPWWHFHTGDTGPAAPGNERGLREGFHRPDLDAGPWAKVHNLAGRGGGRVYAGYGWFRQAFTLPEDAKGEEIVFVLGGYDQQDWLERWVYLNGTEIGHQAASGRWRTPAQFALRPVDAAYSLLQFGRTNLLAVRGRGYDLRFEGISELALPRYVFRPFLMDQFVCIGRPYLRIGDFAIDDAKQISPDKLRFKLRNAEHGIGVTAHYELDGFIRRKVLEVRNDGGMERLLLDVELDNFRAPGGLSEGGQGEPVFWAGDAFCAVEHPAGINEGRPDSVRLWHCPGHRLPPGATLRTRAAIVGAAPAGTALEQFHAYLRERSPRTAKKAISIFTTFGLNNQWGACPTLSDTEILDVQDVVKRWQANGLRLDYFTMDTGWPDNGGDLKEFTPTCYPDGPGKILEGVDRLGMKFGLWFSVSWGGWSCGSNPAIQASTLPDPGSTGDPPVDPPVGTYRNGYPTSGGIGRQLCIASEPYFRVFRDAVVHHVRNNKARLVKFDSGNYYCNSTAHEHLPGKYSVEAMYERLIEVANAARAAAPGVFVIWYWGLGSPFWALHGDAIFESGLFMEGSGTSWYPALHYRDSVTLSLDQNTQFAKLIPPMNKDSLGVWLSQIRWGNFMGKERWREALVMDLGRGNLMFPQLWGDPYLLSDADVRFLAEMISLVRANLAVFSSPRRTFGDSWKNEIYGYTFFDGGRGFVFANNMHFEARRLVLPLPTAPGTPREVVSWFPEKARVPGAGTPAEIWLRPFELLMLEVGPAKRQAAKWPAREFTSRDARSYGVPLDLAPAEQEPWMDLRFADAARLEKTGKSKRVKCFSAKLPALAGGRHVLAVPVRLRRGDEEYRHAPVVAEIVQLRASIGGRVVQLVPVPDARQFGNTQSAGCSWVLYKVPLSARQSGQSLKFAVHAFLPDGVQPQVEAWVVRQWWQESARPQADGYYGDAPS
jgi:hypothetical protein